MGGAHCEEAAGEGARAAAERVVWGVCCCFVCASYCFVVEFVCLRWGMSCDGLCFVVECCLFEMGNMM